MNTKAPYLTFGLVIVHIAMAYAAFFAPDLIYQLGFEADAPRWYTAFTCLFVHQNLFHLLSNLLFLAAVGPAVELAFGKARFLVVYFLGGLVGVLFHWVVMRTLVGQDPLIGASASIAALIGLYSIRFLKVHVMLAPKIGVPVMAVTIAWFVLQIVGGFVHPGTGTVAYWAHIGGFCTGLVLSLIYNAPLAAERQLGHARLSQMESRSLGATLHAADLHLSEHPDDAMALLKKIEAHAMMGDEAQEADALMKLLDLLPAVDAPLIVKRLAGVKALDRLPSTRRIRCAMHWQDEEPDLSRHLLLSVVAQTADERRPDALLELLSLTPPDDAQVWRDELLQRYPLHPATTLARSRGLL